MRCNGDAARAEAGRRRYGGDAGAGRAAAVVRSGGVRCNGDAARAEAGLRRYGGDADHRRTFSSPSASTPDESPLSPSHGEGAAG